MVKPDPENVRKQGAVNQAFRGDDEKSEKIEMIEKFRTGASKSVSFSESEEPKRRNRLNPILPRQKKSLEEDPVCDTSSSDIILDKIHSFFLSFCLLVFFCISVSLFFGLFVFLFLSFCLSVFLSLFLSIYPILSMIRNQMF